MNETKKVSQEEIERRRETYRRAKERQIVDEKNTFEGEMCKIRLNEFGDTSEIHTGKVIHMSDNGVPMDENNKPLFLSWNSIRIIMLDTLDVKPRP